MTVTVTGPVTKTLSLITDYLGQVRLPLDLPAGTYTISATFDGDETYLPASVSGSTSFVSFGLPGADRRAPDGEYREGGQHRAR